jgi:hypothetical protein
MQSELPLLSKLTPSVGVCDICNGLVPCRQAIGRVVVPFILMPLLLCLQFRPNVSGGLVRPEATWSK